MRGAEIVGKSPTVSLFIHWTRIWEKRKIDQSSCNKDFHVWKGFAQVLYQSRATLNKREVDEINIPDLDHPILPEIDKTFNIVVTGVGEPA